MISGIIYKWTNLVTDKSYVGQTYLLKERFEKFIRFSSNYHGKSLCQVSNIDKARKEFPSIFLWKYDILLYQTFEDPYEAGKTIDEQEINYIRKYDCINNGYNMSEGGHSIQYFPKESTIKLKDFDIYDRYKQQALRLSPQDFAQRLICYDKSLLSYEEKFEREKYLYEQYYKCSPYFFTHQKHFKDFYRIIEQIKLGNVYVPDLSWMGAYLASINQQEDVKIYRVSV